jgi:hypothetical protein
MIRKLFISGIVGLLGSAGFILVKMMLLPPLPVDVVLNTKSFYRQMNNQLSERMMMRLNGLESDTKYNHQPEIQKIQQAAERVSQLYMETVAHQQQAYAWHVHPDSVRAHMSLVNNRLNEVTDLYKQVVKDEPYPLAPLYNWNESPEALISLSLLLNQYDVLLYYEKILSDFSKWTDMTRIVDDNLYTFLFRYARPTYPWVGEQVLLNPPLAMRLNQAERVEVRISKKFLNTRPRVAQLTEPATEDQLLNRSTLQVKLLGDAFTITAFEEAVQYVTDDDYTEWEFEVVPLKAGVQTLTLKVGWAQEANQGATTFQDFTRKISVNSND